MKKNHYSFHPYYKTKGLFISFWAALYFFREQAIKREIPIYARNNDIRSEFERDYTRLLHSEAFRRLKHKTQVFYAPHNDHICTRMEHVMHVASVASTIAKYLGLNEQLASAIAMGLETFPYNSTGQTHCNAVALLEVTGRLK